MEPNGSHSGDLHHYVEYYYNQAPNAERDEEWLRGVLNDPAFDK
jgi:hypothetical protein